MKILVLTPWYPDDHNVNHGIFVRDQFVALSKYHDVYVISARVDYSKFSFSKMTRRESTFGSIRETRLVVYQSLPVFNQINFFYSITKEALRIAEVFSPDIIHANVGYAGGVWALQVSRATRVPFVLTEHTRITNNFRSVFHRWLTLKTFRKANAVIAVSAWHAKEIQSYIGRDVAIVPNVIDSGKFFATIPPPDSELMHLGFLGGLDTPVKGLDLLLQALSGIQLSYVLHIGGKGKLLERYKALATSLGIIEKCKFYGFVPHYEVAAFFSRIHFFVSASRYETFGVVMTEALLSGKPIVATDSGGSREFISSTNGILVEADNIAALREGIAKMLQQWSKYSPEEIRNDILSRFSTDRFVERVNTIYKHVLDQKG